MSDSKKSPIPDTFSTEPRADSPSPPAYSAIEAERSTALGNAPNKGFWSKVGTRIVAELTGAPTGEDPYKGTKYEGKSVYQISQEAESLANQPFTVGGLGAFEAFDPAAKHDRLEANRRKLEQQKLELQKKKSSGKV
ncbi:hypothetical protein FRB97_006125 [Tulasnella sp. 331]|nr:hypothetical protein FRB97_006125 [Tulasnella sp. 331]